MERFIKLSAPTIFGHPAYYMDTPGPLIAVSVPQNEFFNSDFGIWIGGNVFQMEAAGQSICTKYGGV